MSHDVLRADHDIVSSFYWFSIWETDGVLLDDLLDGRLRYLSSLLGDSGQPPSRYRPVCRRPRSREEEETHICHGRGASGSTLAKVDGATEMLTLTLLTLHVSVDLAHSRSSCI
jgi:hypothetical protein